MTSKMSKQEQRAIESAQGYLLLDLPDAALRELSIFRDTVAVIDSDSDLPMAVSQLRGEAFRAKEEFEKALGYFHQALPHVEADCHLHMSMAWCFKRVGRLDQAIESMKAAYAHSPKEPIVLYNLACYYSLAGLKHEALSWLGRAFRMDGSLRRLVPKESDFDLIRSDSDFESLMQLSEPKKPKAS